MLQVHPSDGTIALMLDRAQRGNALSAELVDSLAQAVARAQADPQVHTLALIAAGPHFCTGFDLSDLDTVSDGDLLLRFVRIEALLDSLWHCPIRTVAIAQGRAWGAGADIFAACDLRVAGPQTSFRFPGAGFGLVLGTRRLAERVGADLARRWVTEARHIEAPQALQAGLANEIADWVRSDLDTEEGRRALFGSEGWRELTRRPAVDRETMLAIRRASRPDAASDHDLAALVRSASRPGLVKRIRDYREALRASSKP